jgi:polyisoprenoid-binding protein YceI
MPQALPRLPRLAALTGLIAALALPAWAGPVPYRLDPATSHVGFETDFGADKITGSLPISDAKIAIDFQDLRKSTIEVVLDATSAEANLPFAAQAMKGPKVLDTQHYPSITFTSGDISRDGNTAKIVGQATIRDVTKPIGLTATLYQVQGAAPGDYSHLTIRITGAVSRKDFGATGWADMVGDQVRFDILARIDAEP